MKTLRSLALLAALFSLALPATSFAQTYPSRLVRVIVPFPPGGPTDVLGRAVAAKLQEIWKQTVIVENRPGAGTVVGTDLVAKSTPDGHTMGIVITAHVINPSLRTTMPFDTLRDLSGVTQLTTAHVVLVASPGLQANTIADLIAQAKANPGKLTYASPGTGTSTHLAGELLKSVAGINLVHVPYKGSSPAQQDLLGGRVDMMFDVLHSAMPQVRAGKLKILALTSPRRAAGAPEYPVVAETLPGFSVTSMFGLVASSATPRELIREMNAGVVKALKSADLAERIRGLGMEPVGSSPEEFDGFIRSEIDKWAPVVKASGAKVD